MPKGREKAGKEKEEGISGIENYTRYEVARILGARALQLSMNAPRLLRIEKSKLEEIKFDPLKIAELEFKAGVLPITVKRPMPKKTGVEEAEEEKEEEKKAEEKKEEEKEAEEKTEKEEKVEEEKKEESEAKEKALPEEKAKEEKEAEKSGEVEKVGEVGEAATPKKTEAVLEEEPK